MRSGFVPGQRLFSETEPELGLGMVLQVTPHQVTVVFRASGMTRQYSLENSPLKRVEFKVGDTIRAGDPERELTITAVTEQDGLMVYHSDGEQIPETLLSDQITFATPKERLLSGHIDSNRAFELRMRGLELLSQHRARKTRGLAGGRIALIPHQLFIAAEVTSRQNPRVLLADEVGLGKTIESCLILHRLLVTGRVSRVLILVPESLVHQWFIELLRRFNLWFAIFDEERCAAIEQHDPAANPFAENQLVIASLDLLTNKQTRSEQAVNAGWDMLIVDEAHHLHWSADAPGKGYSLVERLARNTPSILLLTATPEQLGEASHFARLRLLDPDRFSSLEAYLEEHSAYEEVARIADLIQRKETLTPEQHEQLGKVLSLSKEQLGPLLSADPQVVLRRLLDQHGTGRVMFRNTRAAMTGFPKRVADLVPLSASSSDLSYYFQEYLSDADPHAPQPDYELEEDPRVRWLAEFLRQNPGEKVLLLCRYREKAEAIESALRDHINAKAALFHEVLPLIQRDRNAAWFAEEDGAQLLICSEIGSEGRNFQFAHHLVLFDLPIHPELLEQRIGRLDRIGQTGDILIHVPFVQGTPQEKLARWYHKGVNAFQQNFSGGAEIFEQFHERLLELAERESGVGTDSGNLQRLIEETDELRARLEQQLQRGRDRLLELHSYDPITAGELVAEIQSIDQDHRLDAFLLESFDHFGIQIEDLGNRTFHLGAGDLFKEKIPALPEEGLTATTSRERALSREDIAFLSWDHPIVTAMLDMLIGSEQGNTALGLWQGAPSAGVFIESVYCLEAIAPPALQVDRFLPPTPLRVVLNHKRKEVEDQTAPELLRAQLRDGSPSILAEQMEELGALLPGMIRVSEVVAGKRSKPILEQALTRAQTKIGQEILRLEQLREVNPSVRQDEIDAWRDQLKKIEELISKAGVRLDALRLILAGSEAAGKK